MGSKKPLIPRYLFDGCDISILGVFYKVVYKKNKSLRSFVFIDGENILVFRGEDSTKTYEEILYFWLKDYAKKTLKKYVNSLAIKHKLLFNDIRIKDTKTRWGSCSSKKNINLNWKLILTNDVCMEYVVVHELAHLKQMNHSELFWNEVEKMMPDWKVGKENLKVFEKTLMKVL